MQSVEIFKNFLGHIFAGEMNQAMDLVDESAQFINDFDGVFVGHQGAQEFFGKFGETFIPGEFIIENSFGDNVHAVFYGKLSHTVKTTGKAFNSDWALVGKVHNEKIVLYHFYENTLALQEAMNL